MEQIPIYVLKAGPQSSPIFESPLGLFHPDHMAPSSKSGSAFRRAGCPA